MTSSASLRLCARNRDAWPTTGGMSVFRSADKWLFPYLLRKRRPSVSGVTDVLLCICDHFEPFHDATREEAFRRLDRWRQDFPALSDGFRDADGTRPAHTFFYPIEQVDHDVLDTIAGICGDTHAEVELHLHHDNDTAENLRRVLERGKEEFLQHGFLCRDPQGSVRYGFVHGDWALDDSHPTGRKCGVRNELTVLAETGCYADFTMPSAPDPCQTRTINSIYYATDTPEPKSHDTGEPMRANAAARGDQPSCRVCVTSARQAARPPAEGGRLLLVQGPLGLNWRRRKWGLLPRLENAEISGVSPPTAERMRIWVDLGVHVLGRPEWVVVKLHTHGALPANTSVLLGEPMRAFHTAVAQQFNDGECFRLHYVTARELVNILHAAEDGHAGDPGEFREYRYRRQGGGGSGSEGAPDTHHEACPAPWRGHEACPASGRGHEGRRSRLARRSHLGEVGMSAPRSVVANGDGPAAPCANGALHTSPGHRPISANLAP